MIEEQQTQHYELLYIVPVQYTVDELPAILDKIKSILVEAGAEVTYEEDFGKRKLTYPIKKNHHGYYRVVEFNLVPSQLKKLDKNLTLSSEILRHLIVSAVQRSASEMAQRKQKRLEAERQQEAKKFTNVLEAAELGEASMKNDEQLVIKKDQPTAKPMVDQEALDKKLDEIIDDTIL